VNLSEAVSTGLGFDSKKLMDKYKDIKIVIPGHGDFGSTELLTHTIELV